MSCLNRYEEVASRIAAGLAASQSHLPAEDVVDRALDIAALLLAIIDDERDREIGQADNWRELLQECGGNRTEAARRLGISVRTIFNWLRRERER